MTEKISREHKRAIQYGNEQWALPRIIAVNSHSEFFHFFLDRLLR
jgi:hypothetical protein